MTKFHFQRIKYKLIWVYLLLIISTLIIVLPITYFSSIEIIKNQSITLNNKLVEMGANNIDSSVEEIDKIFQSLYINSDFKQFISLKKTEGEYDYLDSFTNVKNLLHSYISSRRDIFSFVYIDEGSLLYVGRNEADYIREPINDTDSKWFNEEMNTLKSKYTERVVFPTHTHLQVKPNLIKSNEKVYTIARNIVNVNRYFGKVGSLFINVNLTTLDKVAADIKPYKNSFTYILCSDGTIVYDSEGLHTAESIMPETLQYFNNTAGHEQIKLFDKEYMAVYTTSESTGWKVINFIPVDQYTSNITFVTRIVIIICFVAIAFAIAVTFAVSSRISNPIEKLSDIMKKIDLENMDIKVDDSRQDEIGMLSRSFNSLIFELRSAIQKELELSIRQKDAEMKALQAQINPHFLYNVLQSMSSIAILNNVEEINIMAKSLGKMFQYSIKTKEDVVPVEQEIEHVIHYLSIQKIRFGDKLDYDIQIPDAVKYYSILKLSLQPIIENSIIHGLEGKEEKGLIYVSCFQSGGSLVFEISDNGKGLERETLKKITEELNSNECAFYSEASPSIGLKNVLRRLKIFYGEEASLHIESEVDVGTFVRLKIPVKIME